MSGPILISGTWKTYATTLLFCVAAYSGIIALVLALASVVINRFPENYIWQAHQAIAAGNFSKAVAIAGARVETEHYDFAARRLLAKAALADNRASDAVGTMLLSLDRKSSLSGRDVYSIGFDPAADYLLLSEALTQQGRQAFAGEMARAASDEKRMALEAFESNNTTVFRVVEQLESDATSVLKRIDLTAFRLSSGVSLTSSGTLLFAQNSKAETPVLIEQGLPSILDIQVRGSKVMGIGGILIVSLDKEELIRIYVDSNEPRSIAVPFPTDSAATIWQLKVQFINDGFDPITKADRNVELTGLEIRNDPHISQLH